MGLRLSGSHVSAVAVLGWIKLLVSKLGAVLQGHGLPPSTKATRTSPHSRRLLPRYCRSTTIRAERRGPPCPPGLPARNIHRPGRRGSPRVCPVRSLLLHLGDWGRHLSRPSLERGWSVKSSFPPRSRCTDTAKGEALYRFLLSQAATPPRMFLHCRGSHNETHTRFVRSRHGDRSELTTEQYTERIIDFDFKIDVGQHIIGGSTHWSVGDAAPAYRGRMFREVGISSEKHKAKKAELDAAKAWDKERDSRGFPPWIGSDYAWREDQPHVMHSNSVLRSSWTLRQWADDYCSSRKFLKEFEYHKVRPVL